MDDRVLALKRMYDNDMGSRDYALSMLRQAVDAIEANDSNAYVKYVARFDDVIEDHKRRGTW